MSRSVEELSVSTDGFTVPATEILTGRGFVTGKSGSGKSNTANVVAEELLERKLPFAIVDTDGEYYGLKEDYELVHAGLDESCDLELGPGVGEELARIALEENVPIIVDVSGFLEEAAARDVVHDVVRSLFVQEREHRKPFLLFVEEAHEFIPQRGGGDDLSKMLIRVAKRGRKRGLGVCAMSQRPAAVDKDFITQCDWIVWHRLTWDNDTAVVDRILGAEAADVVQSLDTGEALVMTDWDESLNRIRFRQKRTHDAGATPDLSAVDHVEAPSDRGQTVSAVLDDEPMVPTDRDDGSSSTSAAPDSGTDTGSAEPAGPDPGEFGTGDAVSGEAGSSETAGSLDANDVEPDASSGERNESGTMGRPTAARIDPAWEAGLATAHFGLFCLRSVGWLVDEVDRHIHRRLASPRTRLERFIGSRLPPGSGRVVRWVATTVVAGGFALLFMVVLFLLTGG